MSVEAMSVEAVSGETEPAGRPQPWWRRTLGPRPDETILRGIFRLVVVATIGVVGYDLVERMQAEQKAEAERLLPGETPDVQPFLPSARPDVAPAREQAPGRGPRADLQKPMTIELMAGGRLEATGAITVGTADRFRAEIERRGDYVKTVVLNSPGGSVRDALAMSKLIREKKLETRVEAKGHCASSCPLVFAGGSERIAEPGASIGVHQVFAIAPNGAGADTGMAQAQHVSAECQRHLVDMGVDPRVWIHAMETPPQKIFYFTGKELGDLRLATQPGPASPAAAAAARRT